MFQDKLNDYMNMLNCSGKEFAQYSGISEATVSRYKSGARTPRANSEDMKKLCRGICTAANRKGIDGISYKALLTEFNVYAEEIRFDFDSMQKKFNLLCSVLSVNAADMSKSLKYDSSYISRIRNGKRKPANPQKFAFDAAQYFSQYSDSENDLKIIAEILNVKPVQLKTKSFYASELATWLTDSIPSDDAVNPTKKFLDTLNSFDLNEYIKSIRFDELKVPTLPFQLPLSKAYYGIEEMKNGELDFLKATALSRSRHSVFMYNDM